MSHPSAIEVDQVVRAVLSQWPGRDGRVVSGNGLAHRDAPLAELPTSRDVARFDGRLFTEAHALSIDTDRVRLLELPAATVVTPLAREELKARGIGIRLRSGPDTRGTHAPWGFGIGASLGLAPALRRALASESDDWIEHEVGLPETVRFLAEGGSGSLLFVADAAVVVHDAIAIHGVRAASVWDVDSAVRARRILGAQLIVIEPGSFGITSLVGFARAARRVTSQQPNREGSFHANR